MKDSRQFRNAPLQVLIDIGPELYNIDGNKHLAGFEIMKERVNAGSGVYVIVKRGPPSSMA